ncbi:MAG: hypothetical protein IJL88_02275 [Clostridia bacterium]|nr:hypothetical protein [Clostridia bacterium]
MDKKEEKRFCVKGRLQNHFQACGTSILIMVLGRILVADAEVIPQAQFTPRNKMMNIFPCSGTLTHRQVLAIGKVCRLPADPSLPGMDGW